MMEFLEKIPDTTLLITEYPGHGHILANQLKSSGASRIIAIGGDGTINEIASALMGENIPLGISICLMCIPSANVLVTGQMSLSPKAT